MAQRIQFSTPLYINGEPIQLTPVSLEEKFIAEREADWLKRLSNVDPTRRDEYTSRIDGHVDQLRTKALGLKLSKYDSDEIIAELDGMVGKFNQSMGSFYTYTAVYSQAKLKEEEHNDSLTDRLKNSAHSFAVYQMPTPINPELQMQQEDVLRALALTHVVGEAVKVTADIVFTGIIAGAKTVCKMTPTTEKACRSTLRFVEKKKQALLDTEIVKEALAYMRSCDGSSLADVLVKHYGFPREQANQLAEQHVGDLQGLAMAGTTAGVTYGAVKGIKHLFKTSSAATASTIASTVTPESSSASTSSLLQLGEANQVKNTLDQIYASLGPATNKPLPLALPVAQGQAVNPFPLLSDAEIANLSKFPREYYAKHRTSRITDNGQDFVLKEFTGYSPAAIGGATVESLGLDILESLNLKYLALPKPIAYGTLAQDQFHATLFVLKTHVPGNHLMALMEQAGKTPPFLGRGPLISEVEHIVTTSGKALAELQTKTLGLPQEGFCLRHLREQMTYLQANLLTAEKNLAAINKPLRFHNTEKTLEIVRSFEHDPGGLAAGFGDVHGQQFCWNPKNPHQLGFFDTECVPMTLTASRKPLFPVTREYHAFLNMILEVGHLAALRPKEIKILENAFRKGYFSEYAGPPHSLAADQFYRLNFHIQTIQWVSDTILKENVPLRHFNWLLDETVNNINAILAH